MSDSIQISELFRRKVLHVDRYPANLELVQQVLERREDLRLISVTTGAQCMEMACKHLPAVLLMETVLGDMNIVQLMKELRSTDATAGIPVIAVSSYVMPGQIAAAMEAGVFRYVIKPFKIPDLLQAIDDALQVVVPCGEVFVA
jgi:CheY-like chemotaxis protein